MAVVAITRNQERISTVSNPESPLPNQLERAEVPDSRHLWVSAKSSLIEGQQGAGRDVKRFDPDSGGEAPSLPKSVSRLLENRPSIQMGLLPRFTLDSKGDLGVLKDDEAIAYSFYNDKYPYKYASEWKRDAKKSPATATAPHPVNPFLVQYENLTVLSFGLGAYETTPGQVEVGDDRNDIYSFVVEGELPYKEVLEYLRAQPFLDRVFEDIARKHHLLPEEIPEDRVLDAEAIYRQLLQERQDKEGWGKVQPAVAAAPEPVKLETITPAISTPQGGGGGEVEVLAGSPEKLRYRLTGATYNIDKAGNPDNPDRLTSGDDVLLNLDTGWAGVFDGVSSDPDGGIGASHAAAYELHRMSVVPGVYAGIDDMRNVVNYLDRSVYGQGDETNPSRTTATVGRFMNGPNGGLYLHWASVGDSRVGVFRDWGDGRPSVKWLSKDEVQEGRPNVITNCLGRGRNKEPNYKGILHDDTGSNIGTELLLPGDRIVFITDGIVGDKEDDRLTLEEYVACLDRARNPQPEGAARALAGKSRKYDDKGLVIIDVDVVAEGGVKVSQPQSTQAASRPVTVIKTPELRTADKPEPTGTGEAYRPPASAFDDLDF